MLKVKKNKFYLNFNSNENKFRQRSDTINRF